MTFINKLKSIKSDIYNTYPYRSYFDKCECIFIHIPKAAGTSVLKELSNNGKIYRDHSTWFDYYRNNSIKFNNYFKFTITRNPFDRAISTYTYLKKGGNKVDDLYFSDLFESNNITFEKFILEYLDEETIHEHTLFKPQYLFIYDYKYNLQVDFIVKLENIDKDFEYIKSKISIKSHTLRNANQSDRQTGLKDYYINQKMVDKVIKLYRKDFELLQYDKKIVG